MKRKNKDQKKLELRRQVVAKLVEIRREDLNGVDGGRAHTNNGCGCSDVAARMAR